MQESYGGIFTTRPFEANPKCILLGIIMMVVYWLLPRQNAFLLPIIFIVTYIAIAWYDWLYSCNTKMYTGTSTPVGVFDSIFKPQRRSGTQADIGDRDKYLAPNQEERYLTSVYWFHLLGVVPLIVYIGWKGINADPRAFGALLSLGLIAGTYHTTRLFIPREISC